MAGLVREKMTGCPVHFVWVGEIINDDFTRSVTRRIEKLGLSGMCHLVGEQSKPIELFCGGDLFVLTSREEPMGLAALEAASVGKPVVCFADAGGMPDFVESDCGMVVSPMTAGALADAVSTIMCSVELRSQFGKKAFVKVRSRHNIDIIGPRILKVIKLAAGSSLSSERV